MSPNPEQWGAYHPEKGLLLTERWTSRDSVLDWIEIERATLRGWEKYPAEEWRPVGPFVLYSTIASHIDDITAQRDRYALEVERLRKGVEAYIEAEQLDRDDIRDLCALLAGGAEKP
jgi:hypothetical protein